MGEYIEREGAYPLAKKICDAIDSKEFQRLNFGMRILDWIDDIPAADVRPVVLCRDCVNYGEMLSGYDHRLICHKFALTTKPNFYCACGERRNFGTDMREES